MSKHRIPTVYIGRPRCPFCRSLKFGTNRTTEIPGTNSIERRALCKSCGGGFLVISEDCPDLRITELNDAATPPHIYHDPTTSSGNLPPNNGDHDDA